MPWDAEIWGRGFVALRLRSCRSARIFFWRLTGLAFPYLEAVVVVQCLPLLTFPIGTGCLVEPLPINAKCTRLSAVVDLIKLAYILPFTKHPRIEALHSRILHSGPGFCQLIAWLEFRYFASKAEEPCPVTSTELCGIFSLRR